MNDKDKKHDQPGADDEPDVETTDAGPETSAEPETDPSGGVLEGGKGEG